MHRLRLGLGLRLVNDRMQARRLTGDAWLLCARQGLRLVGEVEAHGVVVVLDDAIEVLAVGRQLLEGTLDHRLDRKLVVPVLPAWTVLRLRGVAHALDVAAEHDLALDLAVLQLDHHVGSNHRAWRFDAGVWLVDDAGHVAALVLEDVLLVDGNAINHGDLTSAVHDLHHALHHRHVLGLLLPAVRLTTDHDLAVVRLDYSLFAVRQQAVFRGHHDRAEQRCRGARQQFRVHLNHGHRRANEPIDVYALRQLLGDLLALTARDRLLECLDRA
ncbi:hypothetical protein D3C78_1223300 [compost metagenome]